MKNDDKLTRVYHQTVKKVTEDYEQLHFNTAISQLMIFVNEANKAEILPYKYMCGFVQLLAPIAPHIAEELWEKLEHEGSVTCVDWPTYDDAALAEDEIEVIFQVNGKLKGKAKVPVDMSKEELEDVAFEHEQVKIAIEGKMIRKVIAVPRKLVNIVAN